MKNITKKLLALLLVAFSFAALAQPVCESVSPTFSVSAASVKDSLAVKKLSITTNKKYGTLKLSWQKTPGAKGYVVYRSNSGKKNSYKKLATVKTNSYTDTGLKNSTTYYYAVRAYKKANGKNVYGKFAYTDLSTRITKNFCVNRLVKASDTLCRLMSGFDHDYSDYVDFGEGWGYLRVKNFSSKAQMIRYLKKYLAADFYEPYLDMYKDINGKLYVIDGGLGFLGYDGWNITVKNLSDRSCTFIFKGVNAEIGGLVDVISCKMIYKNGYWVFTGGDLPSGIIKKDYDPTF